MDTAELYTQRLILRSITPAVVHQLFNTKAEDEIKEMLGVDDAEYQRYKEMHEKGMESHRFSMHYFLIIEKESRRPIGQSGFHSLVNKHRRAELFYLLQHDGDKRKGFMSEALPSVLQFGFEQLALHRIQAMVAAWNTPSIRLLQRNGFTYEGTMREDYVHNGKSESSECWSLLRWEWENGRLKKQ